MNALECIYTRRSVRRYTDQEVSESAVIDPQRILTPFDSALKIGLLLPFDKSTVVISTYNDCNYLNNGKFQLMLFLQYFNFSGKAQISGL